MKAQLIGTFETWQTYSAGGVTLSKPANWHGLDSSIASYGSILNPGGTFNAQIAKETPGNNGSIAGIKVFTKFQDTLTGFIQAGPFPSFASNAVVVPNSTSLSVDLVGGTPFPVDPDSVTMWIKNAPVGGDSTQIIVYAIDDSDGDDSLAAVADTMLGATITTWTKISLPFNYSPSGFHTTKLKVLLSSSGNFVTDTVNGIFSNLHEGTTLFVDDIMLYAPAGFTSYLYTSRVVDIYPTATNESIHINRLQQSTGNLEIKLVNELGSNVLTATLDSKITKLSMSHLLSGQYYFMVLSDGKVVQTGKLMKN